MVASPASVFRAHSISCSTCGPGWMTRAFCGSPGVCAHRRPTRFIGRNLAVLAPISSCSICCFLMMTLLPVCQHFTVRAGRTNAPAYALLSGCCPGDVGRCLPTCWLFAASTSVFCLMLWRSARISVCVGPPFRRSYLPIRRSGLPFLAWFGTSTGPSLMP